MKYTASVFLLLLIILLHTVSSAQHLRFTDAERTIIRLQDERHGTDTIIRYLDSKDEKVAWRAAVALANIHDTNSRTALAKTIIKEIRPTVFNALAFALGALGPDLHSFESLVSTRTLKLPAQASYDDFYIGMARTVPKDHLDDIALILGLAADQSKVPSPSRIRSVSYALVELGLRKLLNEQLLSLCQALDTNDDPIVRWHCAYALARTEDSTLLSKHLDVITVFLKDFNCPESRMFAATALGRIHNAEAGKLLIDAARSEVEWRVRVNIFNAIAKLPRFSSAIDDVIKKAVYEAEKDSLTLNHVARTAIDVLDQMIAAGKVSSPDSVTIREWLTEYLPSHESHQDQSNPLRSQCMIPLARLGVNEETVRDIAYFTYYRERTTDHNVWKAIGLAPDTVAFFHTLERVFSANSNDIPHILEGLHSLWELARKDTSFLHQLEARRYAAMYRHMLIRFASQSDDPAVMAETMEEIKDPLIITDSLRSEAEEYLLLYLERYASSKYHDHLLSIFNTIAWLKPKNDTFKIRLNGIVNMAANDWGDQMIVDSAEATLSALGETPRHRIARLVREPIDWKTIESLPDSMIISTQFGLIYMKLLTYDAPLTVLNMYKLAKENFFANNYFHRIVPNFVIQSGDNTGTGDGGPGYSIRTEISPVRYDDAGVAGMASSGKDTEGSQWFITQCPTPHLNTRYTIWGVVVKGKEHIEKFMLNDQIVNMIPYK